MPQVPVALRTSLDPERPYVTELESSGRSTITMTIAARKVAKDVVGGWRVPGVYLVFGRQGDDILIRPGKSNAQGGIAQRVMEHLRKLPWWTDVLMVRSKTSDYHASHQVGYLEGRLHDLCDSAVGVKRQGSPNHDGSLGDHEINDLEQELRQICAALCLRGVPVHYLDPEATAAQLDSVITDAPAPAPTSKRKTTKKAAPKKRARRGVKAARDAADRHDATVRALRALAAADTSLKNTELAKVMLAAGWQPKSRRPARTLTSVLRLELARRGTRLALQDGHYRLTGKPMTWSKILTGTDAQKPPTTTAHQTYTLRLTGGETGVDPAKFFRKKMLGDANWTRTTEQGKKRETTQVQVQVTIGERDLGLLDLEFSHMPARECNQRNYMTALHWGPILRDELAARDYTGWRVTFERVAGGVWSLAITEAEANTVSESEESDQLSLPGCATPTSGNVTPISAGRRMETLPCAFGHDFERPIKRGVKPRVCPQHAAEAARRRAA